MNNSISLRLSSQNVLQPSHHIHFGIVQGRLREDGQVKRVPPMVGGVKLDLWSLSNQTNLSFHDFPQKIIAKSPYSDCSTPTENLGQIYT